MLLESRVCIVKTISPSKQNINNDLGKSSVRIYPLWRPLMEQPKEEEEEEEVTLQYVCCDETSQWKSERTSNAFCSSANSRAAFVALRQWVATACYYYLFASAQNVALVLLKQLK